jgi:Protein kinase domain
MRQQGTSTIDRDIVTGTGPRPDRTPLHDGDPRRVGRYRLTARLGAGGMGVVYLGVAEDGRLVAVKVMRPELAGDPEFRARFGREIAVLTRVGGARIVRVIEAGTDACGPFLVTEYAAGPSLADQVEAAGPLAAGMLYDLAAGLADALSVIHAAGVVHRDLKPSNVIMTTDGPKVIDFGIAQVLDSVSLTRAGTTIGSVGFMAPEQIQGHAGPAADIFALAVTVAYAASGQSPFGTGPTAAVVYRIMHAQPSLAAVPDTLRPVVQAALAKEPQDRPAAHEIFDQLTAAPAAARASAPMPMPMPTVLSPAWPATESGISRLGHQLSPVPEPSADARPASTRRLTRRRAALAVPAVAAAAVTALALVLVAGRAPHPARPVTAPSRPVATFAAYPGQQDRGLFQTISRIVGSGNTIVTTGAQTSGGVLRQQFFTSADGGASWHLASVHGPGGGQAPLGYAATRLAGGPAGWVATGPQAIWTSQNGQSWTLAATHGIAPQLPGDQVYVLTSTATGFLAAGQAQAPGGRTRAVIWTSSDGVTWQRTTLGQGAASISYAATSGNDTVIAGPLRNGGWGTWLSTDGGSGWTPVSIPAGPGAENTITGLGSAGSGLIAVRPGTAGDALAYFSPNGQTWQYAATIGAAGGFRPGVVKGSAYGFVVTGTDAAGNYLAYSSTGTATTWLPTESLGPAAGYASAPAATVGPGGTVIAAGSATATKTGQQAIVLRASPASVQPVLPAAIPQVAVNSLASAGGQQIAVGSADGYPAIWRKADGGSWTLISPLSLVSANPGLTALSSVTHGPAGWLAVGAPGAVAFTSANGITWHPASATLTAGLASAVGVAVAANDDGYVVVGKVIAKGGACVADVWYSDELTSWTHAHDVNDVTGSSQVLAVAGGPDGFISVGSHNGQPAVWTASDGPAWTTIVLPLPSGATSGVLQQIAISGHRVVALGQQVVAGVTTPLAELSTDGGANFTPVSFGPAGPNPAFTALTADPSGFTAAVQAGTPGQQQSTIWTSPDGATWTQTPAAGTTQLTALAPNGHTVLAAATHDQRPVVLTLPER